MALGDEVLEGFGQGIETLRPNSALRNKPYPMPVRVSLCYGNLSLGDCAADQKPRGDLGQARRQLYAFGRVGCTRRRREFPRFRPSGTVEIFGSPLNQRHAFAIELGKLRRCRKSLSEGQKRAVRAAFGDGAAYFHLTSLTQNSQGRTDLQSKPPIDQKVAVSAPFGPMTAMTPVAEKPISKKGLIKNAPGKSF